MAGCARILLSWWTGEKRAKLELELDRSGHRWPARYTAGLARCGGECGARILAWLDGRDDPRGTITEDDLDEVEAVSGWAGTPGALWAALKRAQLIDVDAKGRAMRWHDFDALNGATIRRRLARRSGVGGATDAHSSDSDRDTDSDAQRDRSPPVSGSLSGKRALALSPDPTPRAREQAGGAAPAPPQRPLRVLPEPGAEPGVGSSPRSRTSDAWTSALLLLEDLGAKPDQIATLRGTGASDAEIYRACRDCLDETRVKRIRNPVGWIWRALFPASSRERVHAP